MEGQCTAAASGHLTTLAVLCSVASHAIQLPRLIGYTSRLLDPDRGRRSGGDLRRTCYRDTSDEAPRSRLGETLASSNRTRASADEAGEYG